MLLTIASVTCLATNIYFEARSEDRVGQYAVAEVTLNRVASPDYPDDVCEVVWQDKQFSWRTCVSLGRPSSTTTPRA